MPYNCRRSKWIRKQCVIQYVPLQIHYVEKSHFHYARPLLCIQNICKLYFSSVLHSLPKCITCTHTHSNAKDRPKRLCRIICMHTVGSDMILWLNNEPVFNYATVHRLYKPVSVSIARNICRRNWRPARAWLGWHNVKLPHPECNWMPCWWRNRSIPNTERRLAIRRSLYATPTRHTFYPSTELCCYACCSCACGVWIERPKRSGCTVLCMALLPLLGCMSCCGRMMVPRLAE